MLPLRRKDSIDIEIGREWMDALFEKNLSEDHGS